MTAIDFKKQSKELYGPRADRLVLVDVPSMIFLMADGRGDPIKAPEFARAVETLYGISYTLKFTLKKTGSFPDYVVPPLECLWWVDNMPSFPYRDPDSWQWTLMIRQPEHVKPGMVAEARKLLAVKKKGETLPDVRFETCAEGPAVQTLHIGAYCDVVPTIEKMHAFITENGWSPRGKHHEIYLNDPRRTAPEKLKTILRQPISKKK
jgi:hypothetical protein